MQLKTISVREDKNAASRESRRRRTNGMDPYAGNCSSFARCSRCAGELMVMVVNVIPNSTPEGKVSGGRITSYLISQHHGSRHISTIGMMLTSLRYVLMLLIFSASGALSKYSVDFVLAKYFASGDCFSTSFHISR